MNPDSRSEADAIRSDIDVTRRRMDDTMDALSNRLHGRHLLDEILGFFRGSSRDGDSRIHQMKDSLSHSASSAMHSVVDTVKANPLPSLVIGAGVAWMIIGSRRRKSAETWAESYATGELYDEPLTYPPAASHGEMDYSGGQGAEPSKMGAVAHNLSEKAAIARERISGMKQRAGEAAGRAKERAQHAYSQTRDKVSGTAQNHPLELGLGLLAAGVLVGLAMPAFEPMNRLAGPTVDRLRQRTRERGREILDKGRKVAHAATTAAKEEARAQGLTPEALKQKATSVAQRAGEAAADQAHTEGSRGPEKPSENPPGSDPLGSRPGGQ